MSARPILGTFLDGDAADLLVADGRGPLGRRYLVSLPWSAMTEHVAVIGASGSGKTVTLLRLVATTLAAADVSGERRRVVFVDAKGTSSRDEETFARVCARFDVPVHRWPSTGLNGMSGGPARLVEKFAAIFAHGESAFHQAEAVAMLDLAIRAGEPPTSLADLIDRCRPGITAATYETLHTIDAVSRHAEAKAFTAGQWNALGLRLRALATTVGDRFDAAPGHPTLRETRAAWISVPGTDSPGAAADIATYLLHLIGELATSGDDTPTLVIIDEASAVTASQHDTRASELCAALSERTRSAGVALVFGAQSHLALGAHAARLTANTGTVINHRTPTVAEDVVALAGTREAWEDAHDVDLTGLRRSTGGRRQQVYGVDPNWLRQAPAGTATILRHGRWAAVAVAPAEEASDPGGRVTSAGGRERWPGDPRGAHG